MHLYLPVTKMILHSCYKYKQWSRPLSFPPAGLEPTHQQQFLIAVWRWRNQPAFDVYSKCYCIFPGFMKIYIISFCSIELNLLQKADASESTWHVLLATTLRAAVLFVSDAGWVGGGRSPQTAGSLDWTTPAEVQSLTAAGVNFMSKQNLFPRI